MRRYSSTLSEARSRSNTHSHIPVLSPNMVPMLPASVLLHPHDRERTLSLSETHLPSPHTPHNPQPTDALAATAGSVTLATVPETEKADATPTKKGGVGGMYVYPANTMFWSLVFGVFWMYSNQFGVLTFLPPMLLERGISESIIGLMLSFYPIAAFFGAPVCTKFTHMWGAENTVVLAQVCCGLSCVVFAFMSDAPLWVFFALRFVQGCFNAMFTQGMYVFVARIYPSNEAPYRIGILETFMGLGCMMGQIVGGFAFHQWGYPAPFLSHALLFMISAVICRFTLQKRPLVTSVGVLSEKTDTLTEGLLNDTHAEGGNGASASEDACVNEGGVCVEGERCVSSEDEDGSMEDARSAGSPVVNDSRALDDIDLTEAPATNAAAAAHTNTNGAVVPRLPPPEGKSVGGSLQKKDLLGGEEEREEESML
eukprot:GDKI01021556.1.p1 GENE.GDKI01021556.1~~GDKI01021556.1.p1  ORF type:complete len:426 (-),score=135.33 GDKI01021556.1:108-1385(-)